MFSIKDFATMKLLESEQLQAHGTDKLEAMNRLLPKMTKNLAFRVNVFEMARIDAVVALLGVTKQEFMLQLLTDGLDRVLEVIKERGWNKAYDRQLDEALMNFGYKLAEPDDRGFRALVSLEGEQDQATSEAIEVVSA
jgi:hypothetical protein